jgi:urease accessory protein
MSYRLTAACLAFLLVCAPTASEAHLVNTRLGDFYGGAIHPLTGFESVLPWLALAILAAFQREQRGRWLLLIFPLGLAAGAGLSVLFPAPGIAAFLNLLSVAGVGLLVAFAAALPAPVFIGLAAVVAMVGGYDNGLAMAPDTNRILFVGGVTAAGYVFVTLASGLIFAFLDGGGGGWRSIALRAGGSWIAAVGVMVLGFELTRAAS